MNGEVSEWLETALKYADMKGKNVFGFRIVVEVEPNKVNQVKRELRKMGFTVVGDVMGFIVVDIKEPGDLDRVAKIPGVKYVSYEKKFAPMALGLDELVKRVNVMTDPLLNKLNKNKLEKLGYTFKPSTELPKPFNALVDNVKFLESVAKNPAAISEYVKFAGPAGLPVMARADWKLVTYTRELMEAPRDNRLSNRTYVAVIDSGVRYGPGLGSPAEIQSIPMTLYPEPPVDCMSHGSWCTACAFGKPAWTRFGYFNPVANAPKCLHVKVFTGMGGCSGFQIMKAMEIAAKKGAKVVSMSLGGALTESIENDPECKLLDQLTKQYGTRFIVAAGNDGPTGWTIGSPGAALEALTVAAFDWKTLGVSSYSSRGPQGQYYKDRKDIFEEHYAKYGDKFIKPDVGGIGGDRNTQVVSACSFWYDGVYDMFPDGWDLMIGTSMATPHVAGLTALLVDRGLVDGVDSIKERMKAIGGQKGIDRGWGLMKYSYFK